MKDFNMKRKIIFSSAAALVILCAMACFWKTGDTLWAFGVFFAGLVFFLLLLLMDGLHRKYTDDLLEQLTLLIESLNSAEALTVFPENKDTLLSRLQHQLLRLRSILLAQNQRLEDEKNQIETLISDIAHQVKTPIAGARTFVELLGDPQISCSEHKEYLEIIQLSLNKLTFLADSMIKMSRLEIGIIQLKPEYIVIDDLVLNALRTVYHKAKEKEIFIAYDKKCSVQVYADFNWTSEAVTNVLDNAVKYTPHHGSIRVEVTEYPSYVCLVISDNGPEIPEEERAEIFQRFYRGKNASAAEGVGVGLYLTRTILSRQNGYVKVGSVDGWTIFSLFLKK